MNVMNLTINILHMTNNMNMNTISRLMISVMNIGRPPAEGPRGGGAARRGSPWGGRPPWGPGGGAPAEGPGGEAPKDFTKPRQTIESPDRLY